MIPNSYLNRRTVRIEGEGLYRSRLDFVNPETGHDISVRVYTKEKVYAEAMVKYYLAINELNAMGEEADARYLESLLTQLTRHDRNKTQ